VTTVAEPIRRPEVDVLADYVEGLLDDDARAQVQRHIAEDPDTAALVAELETLPRLLAATPMEPMPADVVARVDAALARESQDRAAASAADRVGWCPPWPQPPRPGSSR
jgi:anti-sigma factor RsiW